MRHDENIIEFYDGYEAECYDATQCANENRIAGLQAMAAAENFMSNAERQAELSQRPIEDVFRDMFAGNPHQVKRLRDYVRQRGFRPHPHIDKLAMQVNHARGEQIAGLMNRYDPDNFDEVDNFFLDSKERKAARKARRNAKFTRRAERRAAKHRNKMAKLDAEFAETTAPPATAGSGEEGSEDGEAITRQAPPQEDEMSSVDFRGLENPTAEVAHAELIGSEMGVASYMGEPDNFLPFLAAAMKLGTKVAGSLLGDSEKAANTGADIKSLFAKHQKANAAQTAAILNKGVKDMMSKVEGQKKTQFLKDNGVYIALGVVALIVVTVLISRKK